MDSKEQGSKASLFVACGIAIRLLWPETHEDISESPYQIIKLTNNVILALRDNWGLFTISRSLVSCFLALIAVWITATIAVPASLICYSDNVKDIIFCV